MMNRKGDFLNNVVGIIIAVIGLSLLIFAITRLYSAHVNQEDENAKSTIDLVMSRINSLEDGQSASITLQGFSGSEHWYFVGWDNETRPRPEKCFFGNCLCICKDAGNVASCDGAHGFCREIKGRSISVESTTLKTRYYPGSGGAPSSSSLDFAIARCIKLKNSLFEIRISKKSDAIFLGNIADYEQHDPICDSDFT